VDWDPSGDELHAAADHAAVRARRYTELAAEWTDEAYRLADLIADEDTRSGKRSGAQSRIARLMGVHPSNFSAKRTARRAAREAA
jgi:hypothetical protein